RCRLRPARRTGDRPYHRTARQSYVRTRGAGMTKSSGTILDGDSRPRRGKAQEGPSTKSSGTILDGGSRPRRGKAQDGPSTKSSGTILDGGSRPRRGKAQDGPSTKPPGTVGLIAAAALLAGILAGCASQQEVQQRKDAAVYNTELGIAYLRRGDLAIAQTKLDRALEENSDDPNVHSARALLFARMREEKQADREFREALRLAPKNPDYRNNYAVYLCSVGRTDEGVQSFLSAARNPLYMTPEIAY